jgi:hypothetical protein
MRKWKKTLVYERIIELFTYQLLLLDLLLFMTMFILT